MRTLSSVSPLFLLFVLLLSAAPGWTAENWPIKTEIDLSSGFGDFRSNRFHTGLDLRTGGREGIQVYSPVEGYVYRVKTSYYGYGKGLYIMGSDGHLYVYGHLSDFSRKINRSVQEAQVRAELYSLDLYFPPDSIRVARGELIALSGQTGAGAPHLHFEKRTADNYPLNPLVNDYGLKDKIRPVMTRIGFSLTDDHSLLDNGARKVFYSAGQADKQGRYALDTVLYFNRPFGLLVDCYDQMRSGGMKQAVYKLSLYIDRKLYYQVVFDTLDFNAQRSVNLEYDADEAADDEKRVRRLFELPGNQYSRSLSYVAGGGQFGLTSQDKPGLHQGKIVAEDCFGNSSELAFSFIWGPSENIYALDSVVVPVAGKTVFHFTPVLDYRELGIDSVAVAVSRGRQWGRTPDAGVTMLDDGRLRAEVSGFAVDLAVLRLFVFAHGTVISDNIFNGLLEIGKETSSLAYEIVEGGLSVTIKSEAKTGSRARVELYFRDTLLATFYPQYLNMNRYVCFIPPSTRYPRVDRIGFAMSESPDVPPRFSDSLNLYVVGFSDRQRIDLDSSFALWFSRDNFFEPRFIEVRHNRVINRTAHLLNSDYYEVLPELFPCRSDYRVTLKMPADNFYSPHSGLSWLDKQKDKWVWLESARSGDTLGTTSAGGGGFAAVIDVVPPSIKKLNIVNGQTYQLTMPEITFLLSDTLSGIADDSSIVIKLDGRWLIPEYDPETKVCKTRPLQKLENGKHHLAITARDKAGNLVEQYLNFYVRK